MLQDNVGAVTIGQAANIPMGEWLQAGSCSGSAVVLRPSCSPASRPRPSSYRPCDLCGIIPFSGAERHYAEHHPETLTRPCSLCKARFRTFRQLSSHALKVHGPTLLCPTCSEAFIDITDFETHLKVSHNEIPAAFTCVVCQNSLTDVESYCSHMETHQTETRVILEKGKHVATELESEAEDNSLCQKNLRNPVELKTRMKQAHEMKTSFQCQVCFLRYQSSASLLDHIETHATGAINCPLCEHQFAKFVHLRNHCDVVHGNTASFRCHHCSYVAKSINTLFTHAVIRHPDHLGLAQNVQCTKCGEKFHSGRELSQHKASRHAKLVNCEYCGKQYSKYHISAHINEKHTKEHNLDCSFCNKTFYNKTKLSVHIKRHHKREEYAKFICELCSKSYITHSELVRHISSHKNLRRYKCEFCSRAYYKAGDLTYHRRTHTGERPHKCVSCEAAFIRPSELKTHLVRVHGIHHHPRDYIRTADPHIPSLGSGEIMRTATEPTDENLCESVVNIQESSTNPDEQIVTPGGNVPCQLIAEVGDEGLVVEVVDGDMQVVEGVEETMQMGHEEGAIHVPQTLTEAFSQEHVQSFQNDGSDTQVIYLEIVE